MARLLVTGEATRHVLIRRALTAAFGGDLSSGFEFELPDLQPGNLDVMVASS
jgi:hypothetical protein